MHYFFYLFIASRNFFIQLSHSFVPHVISSIVDLINILCQYLNSRVYDNKLLESELKYKRLDWIVYQRLKRYHYENLILELWPNPKEIIGYTFSFGLFLPFYFRTFYFGPLLLTCIFFNPNIFKTFKLVTVFIKCD